MKKIINAFAFSTIFFSSIAFNFQSAQANPHNIKSQQSSNTTNLNKSNSVSEFMVATVTANMKFDVSKNQPQNINLVLAQPFANFPVGSLLRATLHPTEDGNAVIFVSGIVGNGNALRISAESDLLYGETVTISDFRQEAVKDRGEFAALGGVIGLALGKDAERTIQDSARGATFGTIKGYLSPKQVQLVNLSAGTPIFLNLK